MGGDPVPESMTELAEAGYLPTEVDLDAGTVVLARLADADFREVWYADTTATATNRVVVPTAAVTEQFAERVPDEPLRLIAHVSRCGSTLLANLLTLRGT